MSLLNIPGMASLPDNVTEILRTLLFGIQEAIGDDLVGIYLRGSLALGDFDPITSDLDFLAVTKIPVSEEKFAALNAFHTRLSKMSNAYAEHLEGAYIDRAALTRFRVGESHPTIERGGVLRMCEHHANWVVERWIVRKYGITLLGPDPITMIEPISVDELRAAVLLRLRDWADWANQSDDPAWGLPLSHKAYVVETMCRIMYTVVCGDVCSKPYAVTWALGAFPEPWRSLVRQSRAWRTDSTPPAPNIIAEVMRFVHWVVSEAEGQTA